jgi:aspartyl-tRNA(Asn)/glutamyl-tRNA(Gln) amidotransferase subunit B
VPVSVRKKEFESDYGYIDEPDLGIFHIGELAKSITIKESQVNMSARLCKQYGIVTKTANQIVSTSVGFARIFEMIAQATDTSTAVSWIMRTISANWKTFEAADGDPNGIVDIIKRFSKGEMTDVETDMELKAYMTGKDIGAVKSQSADLDKIIGDYLDAHPEIIDEIKKNEKASNRIIGYVMKETGGKYSSSDIVSATKAALDSRL